MTELDLIITVLPLELGKPATRAKCRPFPMKPGKIYDDYLEFETHYYNDEPAEPGVYNGTCYILTVPDQDLYSEKTKHSVEFSVILK